MDFRFTNDPLLDLFSNYFIYYVSSLYLYLFCVLFCVIFVFAEKISTLSQYLKPS